jgi:hypothetical protein
MRFNNRAMALAGIPDLPEEAFKHDGNRKIKPQGGGGGGPTQSTSYQTNIPEYMEPYVHKMMAATEGQVYQPGGGFRPYQSYAAYDQARGGSGETVAGFTPMQAGAMQGLQGYQLPQQGQYGSMMAAGAGLGAMGAGQQYARQATNPMATAAYMSPYMEGAVAPQMREAARQSAMMGQQNQAQAVQQGAFGGARTGIVEAERQRNLMQQQADIYGKGTQTAFEQARQAQQYGADLNLKGLGMGLEGARTMGELGQQQFGQEMGALGKQLEVGAQQQAYEQNRLNQVIQDYATSQQYPFMQLGILSNMIRGQPMQAMTTQSYQAQPNILQQGIGALGMVNAMQGGKKEGGAIKEMASGGIASGLNEYEVDDMSERLGDKQLSAKMGDPNTDPRTKQILGGEVARREQTRKAAGMGLASGGILAFASGSKDAIDSPFAKEEKDNPVEPTFINATPKKEAKKEEKKAAPKEPAGIMGQSKEYKQMERDIGTALADRQKITPYEQTLINTLETEQKRTPQSFLDEQTEMYKAAGADPQFFEKAKTPITKRMAELGSRMEDKKRIREAQAWAMFGSTPGPMLSTALKTYSTYLEQKITDEDELAKAQAELDKAMFDIDKSEYLASIGKADAAMKAKHDSFSKITDLSYKVAGFENQRQKDILDTREKMATQAERSRTDKENARTSAAARVGSGGGSDYKERKLDLETEAKVDAEFKKSYDGLYKLRDRYRNAVIANKDEAKKAEYQTKLDEVEAEIDTKRKEIEARYRKQGATKEEPKASSTLTPGQIIDGYKFKGGNPNDKSNWEKA